MKKLRLDFKNRIVNIVTDNKTVIAYMDDELEKKDFLIFLPDEMFFRCPNYLTFDFEKKLICVKQPDKHSRTSGDGPQELKTVKKIHMPSLDEEYHDILRAVGWDES